MKPSIISLPAVRPKPQSQIFSRTLSVAALLATAVLFAQPASAQVIFSDNFSRVPAATNVGNPPQLTAPSSWTSSWGANNNNLGGSITQTYTTYFDGSLAYKNDSSKYSGNYLNNGSTNYLLKLNNAATTITEPIGIPGFAWVQINHNFATNSAATNAPKLRVTFDLYRTAGGNLNWSFGNNDPTGIINGTAGSPPTVPANDISLYFRGFQASTYGIRDNGAVPMLPGIANADVISYNGSPNITTLPIPIRIEITSVPGTLGGSGSTSTIELWVAGVQQDLNGTDPGLGYTFTWDAEGSAYMVFGSNNSPIAGSVGSETYQASGIDNLVIAAVPSAPQVYSQPESQTNVVGSSATFTVGATGDPTPGYQWYFISNSVTHLLAGATSSNFTRNPVALTHDGSYFVVVSNSVGQATSAPPAVLKVLATLPAVVEVPPTNVIVIKGQPLSLYAQTDGSPPLSHQWRKNGTAVSGATTNPYNIASSAYTDAGNWTVVVTNLFGAATSTPPAVVTVLDVTPPVINNATNRSVAPAGPSGTVVNYTYITATDDKDGTVAVNLTPPSGSLFPPGLTVVTASATDSSSNTSQAYFAVQVVGTIASQTNLFDNFNVSGSSDDINFEYNLSSRQTGVLSPIPYADSARMALYGDPAFAAVTFVDGVLNLNPVNPNPSFLATTLSHEFLESPTFAVEVTVNPGGASSDWAGIGIGSPYALSGPDATGTGMGLVFRSNGQLSVFSGSTAVVNSSTNSYLGGLLPTPPYRVRIEVSASGFGNGSPALVKATVDGNPLLIGPSSSATLVKSAGFTNNLISFSALAASVGSQPNSFEDLAITALPTIFASHPDLATVVGRSNQMFTVTVPASLVATSAVSVVITNANPAVATMVGESGGALTLNYTLGGPSVKTVTVVGASAGTTSLTLRNPSVPVPIGGKPVTVQVTGLPVYIFNGSFEEPTIPAFPGYGPISGWSDSLTTSNGVSPNLNVGGAIPNNSISGHGKNVAFLQSISTLFAYDGIISTTISNLTVGKKYQLSLLANAQQGAQNNANLALQLDGTTALAVEVTPVGASLLGYKPVSLVFTAATASVSLAVSNTAAFATGLLVDDFKVKELNPGRWNYTAWTGDADSGISNTNTYAYAYNLGEAVNVTLNGVLFTGVAGANPANSNFTLTGAPTVLTGNIYTNNNLTGVSSNLGKAFVYNGQTPKLVLQGLMPGARYRLTLFGGGFGGSPISLGTRVLTFSGGDEGLTVDENIFGQGNGLRVTYDFTAAGSTETINGRVLSTSTFHLWAFANQLVSPAPVLSITQSSPTQVRVAWPAAVTGYTLQSSANVASGYTNVGITPTVEGSERVVYQTISGSRFYRLISP